MSEAVTIKILADIKDIGKSLKIIESRFETFGNESAKNVEKISKKINGLGGSLSKIGLAVQGADP